MKIGWLCYGYVDYNHIAADGCANIRIPIISKLIERGHDVLFLGPRRKQSHESILFFDFYKNFVKHFKDKKSTKITMETFSCELFPQIDVLFVETNAMGLISPYMTTLISYYHNKGVRILIWDEDNLYSNFKSKLKILNLDINEIMILSPYSTIKNKLQKIIYYPYNVEKEKPPIKGYGICYIGNDYRRRKQLKHFYNTTLADIYGNFEDEEFKSSMKCRFNGSITPGLVHETINKYLISIQIVRTDYANIGLMTQRINEVLESGTVLLLDSSIKDCKNIVEDKFIVSGSGDVSNVYNWLDNLDSEDYKEIVNSQRDFYQRKSTKYKDILDIIENNGG